MSSLSNPTLSNSLTRASLSGPLGGESYEEEDFPDYAFADEEGNVFFNPTLSPSGEYFIDPNPA